VDFVGCKLFSCRGVECGADVEVLPRRVCFSHAYDIGAEGRDTREVVSVVFAGGCVRESFNILEEDTDCIVPSIVDGVAVEGMEIDVDGLA
jgi:hypothetical protein